ncbi:hypothetical protein Amet_4756 [Alkaliphilus metalliredigens QYMF]|uniref:Uncharacterized protein n=1 Tax=Alkaliphilus metalliredigens (strain QYMF) TaxID=293826 RepID=A6TXA4_ALKMQ|nr:hypothetical protein [Alkaliphilus metalliredigens]ABR50822.1 hypothetical protein Amet_4756 [Alkaliphilus metalliredigens QYMF]
MIKKVIAGTVMIVLISASGAVVYANPDQVNYSNVNIEEIKETERPFQVISPVRNVTTTKKNMILTFTASEGTTVTIDVYHNSNEDGETENFVQIGETIEMEVGSLERRTISVELQKGKNKITFKAIQPNGTKHEEVRFVMLKDIEEVQQEVNESISGNSTAQTIQNILNTGRE